MDNTDKIIRYLDNEMSPEEKTAFEELMVYDMSLSEDISKIQELNYHFSDTEYKDFRNLVHTASNNYHKKTRNTLKIFLPLSAIAAAILVFFIVFNFFKHKVSPMMGGDLFAQYYSPFSPDFNTRGGVDIGDDIVHALDIYNQRDFAAAIPRFQQILQFDSTLIFAKFFLGISYIETNRFDEAITTLQEVSKRSNNVYQMHAQWYLALCYLKLEQMDFALPLLHTIELHNEFYSLKAREIIEKLN